MPRLGQEFKKNASLKAEKEKNVRERGMEVVKCIVNRAATTMHIYMFRSEADSLSATAGNSKESRGGRASRIEFNELSSIRTTSGR